MHFGVKKPFGSYPFPADTIFDFSAIKFSLLGRMEGEETDGLNFIKY